MGCGFHGLLVGQQLFGQLRILDQCPEHQGFHTLPAVFQVRNGPLSGTFYLMRQTSQATVGVSPRDAELTGPGSLWMNWPQELDHVPR